MDVVFDTVGGEVQEKSWGTLKPGGMLVSITDRPSEDRASAEGKRAGFVFIGPNAPILTRPRPDGRRRPGPPDHRRRIRAERHRKAQEASETGRATGKIVIYVGHP